MNSLQQPHEIRLRGLADPGFGQVQWAPWLYRVRHPNPRLLTQDCHFEGARVEPCLTLNPARDREIQHRMLVACRQSAHWRLQSAKADIALFQRRIHSRLADSR